MKLIYRLLFVNSLAECIKVWDVVVHNAFGLRCMCSFCLFVPVRAGKSGFLTL